MMLALPRLLAKAPQDPNQRRLLVATFADALGTGLFLPLSVIYLTRIVGMSPTQVGLGLTVAGLAAVAAVPVSGALVDKFDARWVVLACFALSALGFLAYVAVDSFASFVLVAFAVQLAARMERPAMAALVLGVTAGPERVVALAWQQSLRNAGYGLGGLLAGLALLGHGRGPFAAVLIGNAASYVVAGALLLRLPAVRPPRREPGSEVGYREVIRDRAYLGLALLNVVVAMHDSLLLIGMPLWIVTRTSAPVALTGLLFALNTVLVVGLQVRTMRSITDSGGISRSYRTAALSLTLACIGFALAAGAAKVVSIAFLVLALAALTRGEVENASGEWFLSVELAPAGLRGRYLSVFQTSIALQQAIGPALVTAALVHWGRLGWGALAVVLATAALASRWLGGREILRRRPGVLRAPIDHEAMPP